MIFIQNIINWLAKFFFYSDYIFVGAMGYSDKKFDKETARRYINLTFDEIEYFNDNPNQKFALVSGYTYLGIPGIAYEEAVRRGWKTVGVACSKAYNYQLYPCNLAFIIGKKWRDESSTFLKMCEVFIRVGGGPQSMDETVAAKTAGKTVYEYELPILDT